MISGKCSNCSRLITVRIVKYVSDENDLLIKEVELEADDFDLICETCHE